MEYRKLGRFHLSKPVARGGMGEIVKSVDDSGRAIALKTILQEHEGNETFRDLFLREAEITFQLDHPQIVRAYRFDQVGRKLMLALEYLEGVNVKDILRLVNSKKMVVPVPIAVSIMKRVLLGLDYAHKKRDASGKSLGIIHRDLNPSNIFVTYLGETKLLDFGISKATQKDIHQLTPNGELRGKMCYLSPEQVRGDALDHRSDIFACGIVLWELLAGEPLFLRESDSQVMDAISRAEYKSLHKIRRDIPASIEGVILKALSHKPSDRFVDAAQMRRALEEAGHGCIVPGVAEEETGIFVRALFGQQTDTEEVNFRAGHAWLMTTLPGREQQGLSILRELKSKYPDRPFVQINYARAELMVGDRIEGLRAMRRLARTDSLEDQAQEILEWLGVRRPPVIRFLKRSHPANYLLGKIRHKVMGPTPYQADFLAA